MPSNRLLLGAVAYDPKVVTIWEGFKVWFAEQGLDFDYVLYSNYERQVESHFAGHFDVGNATKHIAHDLPNQHGIINYQYAKRHVNCSES